MGNDGSAISAVQLRKQEISAAKKAAQIVVIPPFLIELMSRKTKVLIVV